MAAGSRSSASGSSACSWASSVGSMAAASLRPAGWKPSMTLHSAPTHLVLQTPREPQVPAGSWSNMAQQVARPILTGHGATWWMAPFERQPSSPTHRQTIMGHAWWLEPCCPRRQPCPGSKSIPGRMGSEHSAQNHNTVVAHLSTCRH
nr:uncharacterized protein LOC117845645 isoform X2 [Setaria viridis]